MRIILMETGIKTTQSGNQQSISIPSCGKLMCTYVLAILKDFMAEGVQN